MARNYRNEYDSYHGTPKQRANRAARNRARRLMEKEGVVSKGDGKDVHHVTPLIKGGSVERKNLKAVPKSTNRSFPRTRGARMK